MTLPVTADELHTLLVSDLEVVDESEFERARTMAARLRVPLERALLERGRVPAGFLHRELAAAWGVGFVDLRMGEVQLEALRTVPEEYARLHELVPFRRDSKLHVAMRNPRDQRAAEDIERMAGIGVTPYLAQSEAIRRAQLLYRGDLRKMLEVTAETAAQQAAAESRGTDDKPSIELVNRLLEYAAVTRASDIHIEPYELESLVRYRIDGVLQEVATIAPAAYPGLVSRIKVLAGMRIDERRVPQDGRLEVDLTGTPMDLRVSSVPTLWGEKIVMRVLSRDIATVDLEDLGMQAAHLAIGLRSILKPFGMVLVTGPTGSGKSTTLYAMLMRLASERQNMVNISTIEDPVEYTMPRVNQIPVNPAAGLEFADGLRALLRQDPDVIMVGEIRDRETAEIAVRAAMVGRLLFSTLHTNDATGAVPRLMDIGVEPYLIASTLSLVVGQRLARRICAGCRESTDPDATLIRAVRARPDFPELVRILQAEGALGMGADPLARMGLFRGRGCRQCANTGYRGRRGIFELFELDDEIRQMIMDRRDGTAIRAAAIARGMKTMFQDGVGKALLGETTLDEVFRVAL